MPKRRPKLKSGGDRRARNARRQCVRRVVVTHYRQQADETGRRYLAVLRCGPHAFLCAIGRSGISGNKLEGDGATPRGRFALRGVMVRRDRWQGPALRRRAGLRVLGIRRGDGWCDAPGDRNYNRPVRLPYAARTEELWREDGIYDVIVVLGHNDGPRARFRGSAVFWHLARCGLQPTEGCLALERRHMGQVLPLLDSHTRVTIGLAGSPAGFGQTADRKKGPQR